MARWMCRDCGEIFEEEDMPVVCSNRVPYGDTYVYEPDDYGCPWCYSMEVEEYIEPDEEDYDDDYDDDYEE